VIAGLDDLIPQRVQLGRGHGRRIRERELVVEAQIGLGRGLAVFDPQRRSSESRQHLVGHQSLGIRQPLVDLDRAAEVARGFRRFSQGQGRRQRHGALRLAIDDGAERPLCFR
jgi:hypothetical protein